MAKNRKEITKWDRPGYVSGHARMTYDLILRATGDSYRCVVVVSAKKRDWGGHHASRQPETDEHAREWRGTSTA